MIDQFELEQKIMSVWGTSEDLTLIYEQMMEQDLSKDRVANMLLGLQGIHDLRSQALFDVYEKLLRGGSFK
jgi:bacterioferritin (cytochrome b1)